MPYVEFSARHFSHSDFGRNNFELKTNWEKNRVSSARFKFIIVQRKVVILEFYGCVQKAALIQISKIPNANMWCNLWGCVSAWWLLAFGPGHLWLILITLWSSNQSCIDYNVIWYTEVKKSNGCPVDISCERHEQVPLQLFGSVPAYCSLSKSLLLFFPLSHLMKTKGHMCMRSQSAKSSPQNI